MDTKRPVALVGGSADYLPPEGSGVLNTALSPETAIRSGFDVFLVETPDSRRLAQDMIRLAEEAGVRVGLARWLRRGLEDTGPFELVNVVGCPHHGLGQLVDLGLWLSGSGGILRLEVAKAHSSIAISARTHSGALVTVQTNPAEDGVRVATGGSRGYVQRLDIDPERGLLSEIERFAGGESGAALLEDSLETVGVLERVSRSAR